MASPPPTTLDELQEQRDDDLVHRILRARSDAREALRDLAGGNVEAACHLLAAIDAELSGMRGLLP
jgi:hypothetical protein